MKYFIPDLGHNGEEVEPYVPDEREYPSWEYPSMPSEPDDICFAEHNQ